MTDGLSTTTIFSSTGATIFGQILTTTPSLQSPLNIQISHPNNDLINLDNVTNNYSQLNTTVNNNGRYRYGLAKWQIILISTLAAVCVVGIIVLILICQFCGKKYAQYKNLDRPKKSEWPPKGAQDAETNIGQQQPSSASSCCPCFRKSKPNSNEKVPGANNNSAVLHSAQLKDHEFNKLNFTKQPPLPPIAAIESKFINSQQSINNETVNGTTAVYKDSASSQQRPPHRRLAPLFQDHERSMEPQSIQNSYSLHGGQQSFSLRGVPVIPVPMDKRRPLPTPPSLE